MNRFAILMLLMAALSFSLLAGVCAEKKKAPASEPEDDIVHVDNVLMDFMPTAQWKDILYTPVGDNIVFCGIEVPFKGDEKKIELTWGETKKSFKSEDGPQFLPIEKEGKKYSLGVAYVDGKWKYWNGTLLKVRLNKVTISSIDLNCDSEYFTPGVDGLIYPNCVSVVPCPAGKFWYGELMAEIIKEPDGIVLDYDKIKYPKEEVESMAYFNWFRIAAGLHPLNFDEKLSAACRFHAEYIAKNGGGGIETPYTENQGKTGYTEDGARIAGSSLYYYFGAPKEATSVMLGHIFYRTHFIKGNVNDLGIGFFDPISVFNASNAADKVIEYQYPIRIPGPEQTIPYYDYYRSTSGATVMPDPRPGETGCGFAITLTWDWGGANAEVIDAKLFSVKKDKEASEQVAVSAPNKPATEYYTDNAGMIALLPLNPLKANSRYHVVIKYKKDDGEHVADWYFNTAKED